MSVATSKPMGESEIKTGSITRNILILAFVLMAGNFGYGIYQSNFDKERVKLSGDLKVISQQIASSASEASNGNEDAFRRLSDSRNLFEKHFSSLKNGDQRTNLERAPKEIQDQELDNTEQIWNKIVKSADDILSSKVTVLQLRKVAADLSNTIPQLQRQYGDVVDILIEKKASRELIHLASRQSLFAERIVRSLQKVLVGGENTKEVAESFGRDVDVFGQVLNGMLDGDLMMSITAVKDQEARDILQEIAVSYVELKKQVDEIIANTDTLLKVHAANQYIFSNATKLLDSSTTLENAFIKFPDNRKLGNLLISGGLLAVVALLLFIIVIQQRTVDRKRTAAAESARQRESSQNKRNQEAIIRLLDEMEGLADGDLTVDITVTEDFTGAIADAINFTVDQLRTLVATIKVAVVGVGSAADETRNTASELAQASKNQAQEITGASAAINEMAVSIEQVSGNAAESALVADKSVEIAHKGSSVVKATIKGMDTIREQIQETSKRIKRLGESSQEIGDIVALINDISDQTNILALNAAIQASMAGDAGRGFAVVADEVQRLAERSGNATKQIAALVKTIQSDTNEAVISMESSTAEVVRGAQLAQESGVALDEIENVSNDLADLIQNISNAARQQAASAGHVSN
ncbi:MAG: chemotaxis protein, partial [Gammaproteobacteria bacterium CG22_combo_CG10-13_8_21_14_all_40_8]